MRVACLEAWEEGRSGFLVGDRSVESSGDHWGLVALTVRAEEAARREPCGRTSRWSMMGGLRLLELTPKSRSLFGADGKCPIGFRLIK